MTLNKEQKLLDKFRSLIDIKCKEIEDQNSEDKNHSLDLGKLIILTEFQELILDHQLELMKTEVKYYDTKTLSYYEK
tara:strand:- start:225 stop:455 length:231 start_codon:yes stop_codon:yes gene_type:complete